jgi:predicted  nucleic acid-binding Zn-ribbon protein
MNIVEDPLNALLQESSNHNNPAASAAVDQAKKHLQTQVSLVHAEVSSLNSQIERLKSDH